MKSKYKSLAYFKDLGGIKTEDGHFVKKGVLFRSSELSKLTDEDLNSILNEEHIDICFDLRTDEEIGKAHDRIEDAVEYYHVPLLSDEDNPAVTKDNRIDILRMRMKEEGGMDNHITSIYRKIIVDDFSIEGTKKIFKIILNSNNKHVIYHCTQGKDRTGMVSALLLMALGVDKETIIADYLEFNKFHKRKRFWIFVGMTIVFFSFKTAKELDIALRTRRRFIEAAFEEIEKGWGNPINYLKKAIGLSDENIAELRLRYLEK